MGDEGKELGESVEIVGKSGRWERHKRERMERSSDGNGNGVVVGEEAWEERRGGGKIFPELFTTGQIIAAGG